MVIADKSNILIEFISSFFFNYILLKGIYISSNSN